MIEFTGIDGWAPFLAGAALVLVAACVLLAVRSAPPALGESDSGGVLSFLKTSPVAIMAGLLYGALETGIFGLMPVFGVRIGLTEATAAQMLTAIAFGNILFQFPIGWMADRFDVRYVLALCGVIGVFGAFSLAMLATTAAIWPILVVWGGTITGLYTVGLTILGRQYSGIALASANAALVSAYGMGALTSPPILGLSMDLNDPYGLAYALAGFGMIFLAVLAVFWKKSLITKAHPALD